MLPGDLLDRIESAYALVEDYRANGRVIVTRQQSGRNFSGRIHWNLTINRTRPVIDCGDVLYLEPIQVRTAIDQEHPFSSLHLATLAHACEWLGLESPDTGGVAVAAPGLFDWLGARNVLERTDHQLFQDRHKQVARWLHRYLDTGARSTSGATTDTAGLFAKSFEWVWEDMLKVALGPASDKVDTRRLQGTYRLVDGTPTHGARLRPDMLIEESGPDGNMLFVIDAKDYEPDVSLPATESLAKQFLYRYLLSGEMGGRGLPLNRICNAFVMPGVVDCPTGVRLLGAHDLAGEEYGAYSFGRVVVLEADFNRVAPAYWNRRPDRALRLELTRIIRMAMERGFRAFNQEVTDLPT